jgi:hypothetical protein
MRAARRPIRVDAIARDDALLDALGTAGDRPEDDSIARALYDWRCDVEADPFPAGSRRGVVARFRGRVGRGVATGAVASAVGLASLGGVAAAATQAGPDSVLWPITRVVAADRVQSREAAFHARRSLDHASTAAGQDRRDAAEQYLAEAEHDAAWVRPDDGGPELRDEAAQLRRRLHSPAAGDPSAGPDQGPSGSPSASPEPSEQPTSSPFPSPSPSEGGPSDPRSPAPRTTTGPSSTTEPSTTERSNTPPSTTQPTRRPRPRETVGASKKPQAGKTGRPGSGAPAPAPQPALSDRVLALLWLLAPGTRP